MPPDEGRPPFLVVVDVGHSIELYAEFSQTGGTYVPFPDPKSHRIKLDKLTDAALRQRLRLVWTDPLSLDPARRSARVTREIAAKLAELAKSLEAAGHHADDVAQFLMRCLFTMFAEDVEPAIFGTLLERALDPVERHKLGAHYTPRAYVERLVMPAVIRPLRDEWDAVRTAAVTHAREGDRKAAVAELEAFHDRLCDIRVLDPACGSAICNGTSVPTAGSIRPSR